MKEPKQKQHPVVDGTGDGSKVCCSKEQYYIGTWNIRSMNQGKLEVVKQEMERMSINILGINELKWTGMGELNSDDLYIYYCGQESLRRNGVAIIVNKRVQNTVLGCKLKNDKMTSVHFQGKPFNITVIQVYAPTSNAEEVEVKQFYEGLQDFLELTPKKDSLLIIGDWNVKVGSQEVSMRDDSTHGHHQTVNTGIRLIIFFAAKDGEPLYSQQKQDGELTVVQIMSSLLPNSDLN